MCAALLIGVAPTAFAAPNDADLSVTLTAPATTPSTAPFTVTVAVRNAGPATAGDVATAFRVVSTGLRVTSAPGGVVNAGQRNVAYVAASLAAGQTLTYTLTVQATADAGPGPHRLDAVTGSKNRDPVATDNTARADVTLTTPPPSARITPDPDTIASAPLATPVQRSYTVQNTGPAFTGSLRGGPLGSARIDRPTIGDRQQIQRQVVVPAGATALSARIGAASDPAADLDLFLFTCASGACVLAAQGAGATSEESVSVPTPTPGIWIVLVDGLSVPAGSTQFDYLDLVDGPAFGSVQVADADAPRPAGSSWTVPGTVTALVPPEDGRQLLATLRVVDGTGATVTTSRVIVESVG